MNNIKVLSAAILLILAKSALAIEVEPNNDSAHANKLGKENVGKLNRASDVDFFSIDSCVKDDKKQCVKYTAADETLNPLNKAGTEKRREDVSLSFTCNNRSAATNTSGGIATATTTGWFLGIHDSNGELQETYPVAPADCIVSDSTQGSFNFRFPSLDSQNYYVSVVADCAAPIYNTITDPKDPTKTIVTVNKFVTVALAKQTDIDATKAEIVLAQTAIDAAIADLNNASFAVINSNANIKNLTDALAAANNITSIASSTLTPATNISAAISTAKAIEIAGYAMQWSIYTYGQFLVAQVAAQNPIIAANIETADAAVATATNNVQKAQTDIENADTVIADARTALAAAITAVSDANAALATANKTLQTAKADSTSLPAAIISAQANVDSAKLNVTAAQTAKITADEVKTAADNARQPFVTAKSAADDAKTAAENVQKAANNVKTAADKVLTDATAKDTEAKTKLTDSLTALADAVKSLNDTVKANIDAANTAENFGKRFDSACKDNYNVGIYTIKDNPDNEIKRLEDITSKAQKNLGLEQSGQISSIDDMDIYVVDNDGTAEVPLLFTCSALALRQTNDWKLSVYNDANGLVSSTLINGSTCGSVFIGDKGGQSVKLPKGSQRYYLAVESSCASSTKKDCVVDTAEYSILRDVDKVYSGKLASKKIDAKSADLKLTNCGLNNNAVISIHTENVNLVDATKLPINVQIGSTACRVFTPDLSSQNQKDAIIGSVADSSEIIDSAFTAKDSTKITLGDCGSDPKSKVTLTGSKLDLVNFNPKNAADSVVIPIKVNIGEFHCETKEVFYVTPDATGTATYSNISPNDVTQPTVPVDTTGTGDTTVDPMIAVFATAKNVGASQTNALKLATDIQAYYVDTGLTAAVDFTFSCPTSTRFANDWVLSIYDNAKKLKSSQTINGSDCGTGLLGDNGTFGFTLPTNSPRSYVVITSACAVGDTNCVVDTSQYQIQRLIPSSTAPSATTAAPCFHGTCDAVTTSDFPVFGTK